MVGTECNCHGLSFAGGNIIIEDISENTDAINTILNDDSYWSSDPIFASLIIVKDEFGNIGHSVLQHRPGKFSVDHGYGLPTINVD